MARKPRLLIDGAMYHVYCRTARGLRAFDDPDEAAAFVDLVREIKERDGWTVFAWCVMPTHYHLALCTSSVQLSKSMHAIQGRFAQAYNRRHESAGAFWQGRFRAQMVVRQDYIEQLVFYIHLNPVKAGLVGDASRYRWSGHREILAVTGASPLIDIDDSLQLFGRNARQARLSYLGRLETALSSHWSRADAPKLPWWVGDDERTLEPNSAGPQIDEIGRSTAPGKPRVALSDFISAACDVLQVTPDVLAGRSRLAPLTFARHVIATVGVHSCSLRTKDLASRLGRHADSVSKMAVAGLRQRRHDHRFRQACEELEGVLVIRDSQSNAGDRRAETALETREAEPPSGASPSSVPKQKDSWEVWD